MIAVNSSRRAFIDGSLDFSSEVLTQETSLLFPTRMQAERKRVVFFSASLRLSHKSDEDYI